MAGRIRSIKPELLEDEATAGLSHVAFRLFVGMILLADDHGNLRAARAWLKGQVFHGSEVSDRVFDDAMVTLQRKLVSVYKIDGQTYAHVNGWTKHQRIDNAMAPRVPVPPGWEAVEERREEGSRKRARWISRPANGAAPSPPMVPHQHGDGAAPHTPTAVPGADPPRIGAAGLRSPITDHRPPISDMEGAAPPHQPPKSPPSVEDPIEAIFASCPELAADAHAVAIKLRGLELTNGRPRDVTLEDVAHAVVEDLAVRTGIVDPKAYALTICRSYLRPGVLEERRARERDAAWAPKRRDQDAAAAVDCPDLATIDADASARLQEAARAKRETKAWAAANREKIAADVAAIGRRAEADQAARAAKAASRPPSEPQRVTFEPPAPATKAGAA